VSELVCVHSVHPDFAFALSLSRRAASSRGWFDGSVVFRRAKVQSECEHFNRAGATPFGAELPKGGLAHYLSLETPDAASVDLRRYAAVQSEVM
ncbi:MAG: hypothetical protein AAF322_01960, partial [Pseudomonadota bacterium]